MPDIEGKHVYVCDKDIFINVIKGHDLIFKKGVMYVDDKPTSELIRAYKKSSGFPYYKNKSHCDDRMSNLVFTDTDLSRNQKVFRFPFIEKLNMQWAVFIPHKSKLILVGIFQSLEDAVSMFERLEELRDKFPADFRSRYYFFVEGERIGLPSWFCYKERKRICQTLIDEKEDLFTYNLPKAKNDTAPLQVQKRLSVFASYLIEEPKEPKEPLWFLDEK